MKMRYKYSVAIPHYNSVDLLTKMIASIPERDDIEVIVVDDGSTEENKAQLMQLSHKNMRVVLSPENRGGGHARQVGLLEASGEWFITVDADDYLSPGAFDVFDRNLTPETEVLMFCSQCEDESGRVLDYVFDANKSVLKYLKRQNRRNENLIRYYNTDAVNKLVSLDFIRKYNISFEDTRVNIDVLYTLSIGLYAKNIKAIPDVLYHIYMGDQSITRKKRTIEREFTFYIQAQKRNGFFEQLGMKYYPYYRHDILYVPHFIKKRGFSDCFKFFAYRKKHLDEVKQARSAFVGLLK